jgi:hypothetical protein
MNKDIFIKLWNSKKTVVEIREILGISERQVKKFRELYKLNKRHQGRKKTSRYPHTIMSAYLLGVAMGDGNLSKVRNTLRLRLYCKTKHSDLLLKWKHACEEVTGNKVSYRQTWAESCREISVYSNMFEDFIWKPGSPKHLQGLNIPLWIIQNNWVHHFLTGLFEADGYASEREIYISSSSRSLIWDIKDYLDSKEIRYYVYEDNGPKNTITNYKLHITTDRNKFQEIVKIKRT